MKFLKNIGGAIAKCGSAPDLEHTCFKKGEWISLLSNASSICNLFIKQREGETVSKKGKERTIKVNSVEAFWWLR